MCFCFQCPSAICIMKQPQMLPCCLAKCFCFVQSPFFSPGDYITLVPLWFFQVWVKSIEELSRHVVRGLMSPVVSSPAQRECGQHFPLTVTDSLALLRILKKEQDRMQKAGEGEEQAV